MCHAQLPIVAAAWAPTDVCSLGDPHRTAKGCDVVLTVKRLLVPGAAVLHLWSCLERHDALFKCRDPLRELTYEDPEIFVKPWKAVFNLVLAPGENLMENICENNKFPELSAGQNPSK